ncbi:hypothetical protein X801_01889 [Opisthorchis viverrini]|uniref:Uncharacterized protein n=1 Tax=Opisthorchis viverrini TaxID=6198 RepID=A0A1S8X6Z9_OPIVI|nr:hypothetical protein X801_01889 [Opisthorchis viverrini]
MAVVGLQITHHKLQKQFDKMTNTCLTENCRPCGNEVDCYLINQAALVLASSGGEKEPVNKGRLVDRCINGKPAYIRLIAGVSSDVLRITNTVRLPKLLEDCSWSAIEQ